MPNWGGEVPTTEKVGRGKCGIGQGSGTGEEIGVGCNIVCQKGNYK